MCRVSQRQSRIDRRSRQIVAQSLQWWSASLSLEGSAGNRTQGKTISVFPSKTKFTAIKSACKTDFYKFCPSYKQDSPQLRDCMASAGGNISSRCIDALADSGIISHKYHSRKRQ